MEVTAEDEVEEAVTEIAADLSAAEVEIVADSATVAEEAALRTGLLSKT